MIRLIVVLCAAMIGNVALADGPKAFANRLASGGSLYHDASYGGRENVFYSSNTAFPRMQARAAWMRSPGHRANLPMVGLRVARVQNGVYVVGRR